MTVLIDYATISPQALTKAIKKLVPNAICSIKKGADIFSITVEGRKPLSLPELIAIESILAQYV